MHLKYRPTTLDEIIGLDSIKKSLSTFKYDVPVLFWGARGCGKTTLAQILAKSFCKDEPNIREINCGYYTKIDDMRAEIDRLYQTSLYGKNRVLILDEIHRLSEPSQNAWLIPLEKFPEHTLVIACTTEPNKLIDTLKRRFVDYGVHTLSKPECKELIDRVLEAEGIEVAKWVKVAVIEHAEGVPGLILTALPKVMYAKDEAEVYSLLEVIKMEQEEGVLDLLKMIINNMGWGAVKKALGTSLKASKPDSIRISLMNLISGRMMSDYATNNNELIRLADFYDDLKKAEGFPEKANLINAVYKGFYKFHTIGG
jgi:DNA polymerase III gamma/tau subunit